LAGVAVAAVVVVADEAAVVPALALDEAADKLRYPLLLRILAAPMRPAAACVSRLA
jgi:hypothetical protein